MKRMLTLALALLMLIPVSALAINETGYPISDEAITLTLSGPNTGTVDWNDTNMVAELEARLGIRLEATSFEGDIWATQFTLMLASDELTDLIVNPGITLAEVANYGGQGYLLDMAPYLEQYGPNITAQYDVYPTFLNYNTSPDGGIYTFNQLASNTIALVPRCWLNKTWMDNLGLSYPNTVEELYDVLVAFKEQDADGDGDAANEIPLSGRGEALYTTFLSAYGFNTRASEYLLQADEQGKLYLGETTQAYQAYLTTMNRFWNEGLIDVDFFVQNQDEFRIKAAEGRVGMFADAAPFVAAGEDISYDANFYWIGALTSEYNATPTIVKASSVNGAPKVLVSAATEHPETVVRFLDFFFTFEGTLAGSYGFEGVDFDLEFMTTPGLEEYGIVTMHTVDGYGSSEEYRYKKAIINEAFNLLKPLKGTQYAAILEANTEQLEALLPEYGWAVQFVRQGMHHEGVQLKDVFPSLLYTDSEATERTQLSTDLKLYLSTMHAQFITGQASVEKDWDAFLAQLEAMQMGRLLEIEQAAYDRLMGA